MGLSGLLWNIFHTFFGSLWLGLVIRVYPDLTPEKEDVEDLIRKVKYGEIAHRGGAQDAPENTLYAFDKAVLNGASTIELDIQYTGDGVPVVIHDETLDRTTNGSGLVQSFSSVDIQSLKAHATFSDFFGNIINTCCPMEGWLVRSDDIRVPTLDEAVDFAIKRNIILLFDVKGGGYCSKVVNTITSILDRHPTFINQFAIISFFPDILYAVRKTHPKVMTGFTRRHDDLRDKLPKSYPYYLKLLLDRLFDFVMFYVIVPVLKINMLEVRSSDVCESYIRDISPLPILTWTVNDPVQKSYFKMLGCGIMTDTLL